MLIKLAHLETYCPTTGNCEGLFESLHSPQEDDSEETQEDDSEEIIITQKMLENQSNNVVFEHKQNDNLRINTSTKSARVGKLVAMLALSSETKEIWDDTILPVLP